MMIRALVFGIDRTLAETEEGHRRAFNAAFSEAGLDWAWDVDLYRELYRVTSGKERIRRYADMLGLSDADIGELHARKNARYAEIVRAGHCPLRFGVEHLIRTSRESGLRLAVCSTTSPVNIVELAQATLPPEGLRASTPVTKPSTAPRWSTPISAHSTSRPRGLHRSAVASEPLLAGRGPGPVAGPPDPAFLSRVPLAPALRSTGSPPGSLGTCFALSGRRRLAQLPSR